MQKAEIPTSDATIRAVVKKRLAKRHEDDVNAFVVEELPVSRGEARLDMAVINGRIEGVEIKSSLDTLERLPRQIELYQGGVDRMSLVSAARHLEEALTMVPDWWSVFEAIPGTKGGMSLKRIQQGKLNPNTTKEGYLRLLERDELLSLLSVHGLDRGWRSASWDVLADRALHLLPNAAVSEGVRRQLKIRVLIEARISQTAFGNSAVGGGLTSDLIAPYASPTRLAG